jgi:hypothetical protein
MSSNTSTSSTSEATQGAAKEHLEFVPYSFTPASGVVFTSVNTEEQEEHYLDFPALWQSHAHHQYRKVAREARLAARAKAAEAKAEEPKPAAPVEFVPYRMHHKHHGWVEVLSEGREGELFWLPADSWSAPTEYMRRVRERNARRVARGESPDEKLLVYAERYMPRPIPEAPRPWRVDEYIVGFDISPAAERDELKAEVERLRAKVRDLEFKLEFESSQVASMTEIHMNAEAHYALALAIIRDFGNSESVRQWGAMLLKSVERGRKCDLRIWNDGLGEKPTTTEARANG